MGSGWLSGDISVARRSTAAWSWAARRPQRKACLLGSTATPLSSIACSMAAAEIGISPF